MKKWIVIVVVLLAPAPALAFHTGSTYAEPPGAGGGGGVFYTGAPTERGWTCAACHVEAPQQMRVSIDDDRELFDEGVYAPGEVYEITVRIEEERLGLAAARSNFNGMALTVQADDPAIPAGSLTAGQGYFLYGRSVLATDSTTVGETEWTFRWTAPDAGSGRLTFYLGVVDGNGAGAGPTETLTDPFGDDVATGALEVREAGNGMGARLEPRPEARRWARGLRAVLRRRVLRRRVA